MKERNIATGGITGWPYGWHSTQSMRFEKKVNDMKLMGVFLLVLAISLSLSTVHRHIAIATTRWNAISFYFTTFELKWTTRVGGRTMNVCCVHCSYLCWRLMLYYVFWPKVILWAPQLQWFLSGSAIVMPAITDIFSWLAFVHNCTFEGGGGGRSVAWLVWVCFMESFVFAHRQNHQPGV